VALSRLTKEVLGGFFTLNFQIAFGHGCDQSGYVDRKHSDACFRWQLAVDAPVTTAYQYDANGNRTNELQIRSVPGGTQTIHTAMYYDAQNRVTNTVIWADGEQTLAAQTNSVAYNLLGKQATSTDAAGRVTTNVYDFNGNQIETDYPDGTMSRTAYDAMGRQQYVQDRSVPDVNSNTTAAATYSVYDASGRVIVSKRCSAVELTKSVASPGSIS
jgi:YD repeat-containing protein